MNHESRQFAAIVLQLLATHYGVGEAQLRYTPRTAEADRSRGCSPRQVAMELACELELDRTDSGARSDRPDLPLTLDDEIRAKLTVTQLTPKQSLLTDVKPACIN